MNPVPLFQLTSNLASGATPNVGPSLENTIFDPTLYALTALIGLVAILTAIICVRTRGMLSDQGQRSRAIGTGMSALGYSIVLVAAISLLTLMRDGVVSGFIYLQAEFIVAYLASAMILYGVDKTVFPMKGSASRPSNARREIRARAAIWAAFFVSVGIALAYLLNPSTYTVTSTGLVQHVAQQGVFWLPAFFTVVVGALTVPVFAVRRSDGATRRHAIYLSLFFFLVPIGMSKESNLIPSLGDPLLDMLVAFVPFTAASFCLLLSATRLRRIAPDSPFR